MKKSWRFSRAEIGLAVASVCAVVYGVAQAAPTPHMRSSSLGLASGQTARLTVSNIGVENPTTPSDPCMVQLKVYGTDGSVLVTSGELKIAPGASTFHDLKYTDLLRSDVAVASTDGTAPSRFQLRAEMFLVKVESRDDKQAQAGCTGVESKLMKMSVEVFDDDTGRTSFSVPTDSVLPAVQK